MAAKEENEKQVHTILQKVAERVWTAQHEKIPALFARWFDEADKKIPKVQKSHWEKWCDKLVTDGFCDQDTADLLKPLVDYPFPFGGIFWLLTVFQTTMQEVNTVLGIYALDRQYDVQAKTTPNPAPVDNLIRSMIIDPGRSKENRAQLKRHGFSDTQIDNIVLSYYRTVDEGTVRSLFLRGAYDNDMLYERMRELGYTDTRIAEIAESWKVIPGPQDLLTMVAHEAFEPDMYKLMGLDDEFPEAQVKYLEAHGISKEWALRYWYSHWQQPSIGMGYEMLHRGQINLDELDMLYRTVEIPPYWREKLTAIAYTPYARVDVRRMHELGVIDNDTLVKAYTDIGYDLEHATKLAEFTVDYNAQNDKQLTRSAILESYGEGLITKTSAKNLLTSQKYNEDLAEYYLTLEDYNREKEVIKVKIDSIKEQFLLSFLSEKDTRDDLNKLGLLGSKVDALIESWQIQRYKYESTPSRTDLESFYKKGIISEGKYREYMQRIGYNQLTTDLYIAEMQYDTSSVTKFPSRTDLAGFYKNKILSIQQWRDEMSLLGYPDKYITMYEKLL